MNPRQKATPSDVKSLDLSQKFPGPRPSRWIRDSTKQADNRDPAKVAEPENAQLIIFFAGKIMVYDDFPSDKANEIMDLVAKQASSNNALGLSSLDCMTDKAKQNDSIGQRYDLDFTKQTSTVGPGCFDSDSTKNKAKHASSAAPGGFDSDFKTDKTKQACSIASESFDADLMTYKAKQISSFGPEHCETYFTTEKTKQNGSMSPGCIVLDFVTDKAKQTGSVCPGHIVSDYTAVKNHANLSNPVIPDLNAPSTSGGEDNHQARHHELVERIARRASLHRFFAKRKDRAAARAPYQANLKQTGGSDR